MVTLGADSHKATHTVVAVDETGRKLSQVTVKATSDGHLQALSWASQWSDRRWALEDCRHVSGRLERDLLGPAKPWSGCRLGSQLESANPPAPQASQTPSMPSRRRALRCESRTCQQQRWTVPVGRCASW
jgi:hypothetical protein